MQWLSLGPPPPPWRGDGAEAVGRARAACLDRAARKAEEAAGRWRPPMGAGTSGAWRHSQLLPGEGDLGGGPETHRCGGMKNRLDSCAISVLILQRGLQPAGDLQAQRGCGLLWSDLPLSLTLPVSRPPPPGRLVPLRRQQGVTGER